MESEVSEGGLISKAASLPLALPTEETLDQNLQSPASSTSTSSTLSPPPSPSLSPTRSCLPMEMEGGEALIYPSPAPLLQENNTLDDDDLYPPTSPMSTSMYPFPYLNEPTPSLFSPFSFEEQKPSLMGAGLSNLGNTCFLNSILQCFTHTVPFLESLRSYDHQSPCFRSVEGFCVICTLREHIEHSLTSSGRVISPYSLVDNISNLSSSFRRYQQEDAHEFLQCLLDKLDSCHLDMNKQVSSSSSQEDSFVKKIFGGRLKSQLRCCNCGNRSDTFEPLIDLSLEIEDADTLPDALTSFTKVEEIEDSETKFTCEICEQEVQLEKQFTLDQAPSVATFHLKRFKNDGYFVEKIDKYVEYPLELDLQPYTSSFENFGKLKYVLYAVVVHIGFSYSSGHYFCYIRSAPDTWYKMDDSKVVRVSEKHVLSQEAYILFYAREGTPWFSSFMEEQIQCMAQNTSTTSPTSVLDDMESICPPPQVESTVIGESTNMGGEQKIIGESTKIGCEPKIIGESTNMGGEPKFGESTSIGGEPKFIGESTNVCGEPKFDTERISSPPLSTCSDEVVKDRIHSSSPPHVTCTDEVVKDRIRSSPPLVSCTDEVVKDRIRSSPPLASCTDGVFKDRMDYNVCPKTPPPRSPSPDIYADEPPGTSYDVPRGLLKMKNSNENRMPCRSSSATKALVETKRKEAIRLTRSMPSSKARILRDCMMAGPQGDRSSKRKKRKNEENCSPLRGHRRLIDFDENFRYKK